MAKQISWGGKKVVGAIAALTSALFLLTSCGGDKAPADHPSNSDAKDVVAPQGGPVPSQPIGGGDVPAAIPAAAAWSTVELLARTDPADPHNERFLDDWVFRLYNIDDSGRITSPIYSGESGPNGGAVIGLPAYMFALPIVVFGFNEALEPYCPPHETSTAGILNNVTDETDCQCRSFEIFIPPFCHDKAVWLLGPFENALWRYYRHAAHRRGESWNPSQVDCGTWLANLQALILTDEVTDELNELSDRDDMVFRQEALIEAFQENTQFLTPTRPPICMAERRHNGGGMERAEATALAREIDDDVAPWTTEVMNDNDPVFIGVNGVVDSICGIALDGEAKVNTVVFAPTSSFILDDEDFMGVISDQPEVLANLDMSIFNVRLGNGRELDHDKYDDACALTSILEFTNKDDDENDLLGSDKTGVTFTNLLGGAAQVHLTSDGDNVINDNDTWAIFYDHPSDEKTAKVIGVELLGHRKGDFRDVLHMTFNTTTHDLFLGLRADYEMNEEEVDGERAFLAYTIHVWDGSTPDGLEEVRRNISNCYEAADVWSRQFFVTQYFQTRHEECCIDEDCDLDWLITPLRAAEFAVRSQCFSNSRANQRWRTEQSGYWSINTEHGVPGDILVNVGWLAPNMDYEIFIQKFDEAVFKGPRTVKTTDDCGQLLVEMPTLVEGDRVLIKSEDNCCDDYDLIIPCVPEFTGFAGAPGIPFVPVTLGPPPPGPLPVPGIPGPGPGGPGGLVPGVPGAPAVPAAAPVAP